MKKMKTLILAVLVMTATMFTQCAKEPINNKGEAVFYYTEDTSEFLTTNGAVSLTYYVDGSIVGSSAADTYFESEPNCGQGVSFEKELGEQKSKSYSYKIEDQDGDIWFSGTIELEANTCTKFELHD